MTPLRGAVCVLLNAAIAVLVGCASIQPNPALPVGTKVSGVVQVGVSQVPIGPGDWVVMSSLVHSSSGNSTSLPPIADIVIGEVKSGVITRAIAIASNMDAGPSGGWVRWSDCDRRDMIYAYADRNYNMRDQVCWNINHYVTTLDSDRGMFAEANKFMDRNGWQRPLTTMTVGYGLVSGDSFLLVRYFFNPEVSGIAPAAGAWRVNEWHRDRYRTDPKKVAYVEKLRAWGEAMLPVVARGLERKLATNVAAVPASPFE
jgi:hypothetical protein